MTVPSLYGKFVIKVRNRIVVNKGLQGFVLKIRFVRENALL